jgi:multicomponent Na+:H+ antiporter subunit B
MNSLILRTATRFMLPLLLLFSLFLLIRGHNEPGGGFVAGLVAASSFALHALAFGVPATRTVLGTDPRMWIGIGLLTALGSGAASLAAGRPFLTGLWAALPLPSLRTIDVGTPIIFDVGVYLVVAAVTLTIILSLAEEPGQQRQEGSRCSSG